MKNKRHWSIPHLLLLAVNSCILVPPACANTTGSSNSTDHNIAENSTIEQQRKEKLKFIVASRLYLQGQKTGRSPSAVEAPYSIDLESGVMSYIKCDATPSRKRFKDYQCYDCIASFDDLRKSEAATENCLKQPKK